MYSIKFSRSLEVTHSTNDKGLHIHLVTIWMTFSSYRTVDGYVFDLDRKFDICQMLSKKYGRKDLNKIMHKTPSLEHFAEHVVGSLFQYLLEEGGNQLVQRLGIRVDVVWSGMAGDALLDVQATLGFIQSFAYILYQLK